MGYCPPPTDDESPPQPPDQVDASQGRDGVYDPQEPDIWFDFPPGAVPVPIEARAYRTELPADVLPPVGGMVGAPFYFGAWIRGEARTVGEFGQSVVIHVRYTESDLDRLPTSVSQVQEKKEDPSTASEPPGGQIVAPRDREVPRDREEQLQLGMFDPVTLSWLKLCSEVDPYANIVSGALLWPTPLEEGGNALFAIISDETPAAEQTVDDQGNTTLSIPESNLRLEVLAETVDVGSHFLITLLPEAPASDVFTLIPAPVDIKACYVDDTSVTQLSQFPKPVSVAFDVDADTLSRAGSRANLTILGLQDRHWVDLEEFGYQVVRGHTGISVDTGELGTFGAAVR